MKEILKNHIAKFVEMSEEEYVEILNYFTVIKVDKKQNLLIEGGICKFNYFVCKGCLRLFLINEKGVEQTIQFALENWWLADYTSFSSQMPSDFYIQAVEESELLALDSSSQDKMLKQFPQMERYFRFVHQRAHAAYQFRLKLLYSKTREELYHLFNN